MGRYPAEALDMKFAWMRAKQRKKAEREALQPGRVIPLPPDPPLLPQMLRVPQVAEALGVSLPTVRRWFKKRAVIVKARQNSVMLIPQRAFDDWVREHTGR